MIANFAKLDATSTTDPKLSTYVDAKTAFDTDINSLIKLNTPTTPTAVDKTKTARQTADDIYYSPDKTTKTTTTKDIEKLNGLLDLTKQIGYLIQLKNLEA